MRQPLAGIAIGLGGLLTILLLSGTAGAVSPPAVPAGFYGTATLDNGTPVPDGTAIAVRVDDGSVGTTTVSGGAYEAYLPADAGARVTFTVGNATVGNASIEAGTTWLPLTVPTAALAVEDGADDDTGEASGEDDTDGGDEGDESDDGGTDSEPDTGSESGGTAGSGGSEDGDTDGESDTGGDNTADDNTESEPDTGSGTGETDESVSAPDSGDAAPDEPTPPPEDVPEEDPPSNESDVPENVTDGSPDANASDPNLPSNRTDDAPGDNETDTPKNETTDSPTDDGPGGGGSGGGGSSSGGGGGGGGAPVSSPVIDLTSVDAPSPTPANETYTRPVSELDTETVATIEAVSPVPLNLTNRNGTAGVGYPVADPSTNRSLTTFASGLTTDRVAYTGDAPAYLLEGVTPESTGPAPGAPLLAGAALTEAPGPITLTATLSEASAPRAADLRTFQYADGWTPVEHTVDGRTVQAELSAAGPFAVVHAPAPTAAIEAPAEAEAGEVIVVSAAEASVPAGEIVAYRWEIGDRPFRGPAPVVQVPDRSSLEVTLTVETDAGRTATATETVSVQPSPPFIPGPTPGLGIGVTLLALVGLGGLLVRWVGSRRS